MRERERVALHDGFNARMAGKAPEDNPHKKGGEYSGHRPWQAGWEEADALLRHGRVCGDCNRKFELRPGQAEIVTDRPVLCADCARKAKEAGSRSTYEVRRIFGCGCYLGEAVFPEIGQDVRCSRHGAHQPGQSLPVEERAVVPD